MTERNVRPETLAAQALGHLDKATGAIIPPIHPSATYERGADLSYAHGRVYSRADNPTYGAAASTLMALEGGAATLLFGSGMAAATAVFQALDPGDHVIVPQIMYWALRAWLTGFATRWGLKIAQVENGNGHSGIVAGTLTTAAADEFWARIKAVQVQNGGIAGPFEAWLLQRGLRTLFARVRWQCASAQLLAARLQQHPAVAEVLYPGLPDFPRHDIARRQMQGGFGAMLSIRVKGGEQAAIAAAAELKVWRRATSLGGVESLAEHRASIEGAGSPVPRDLLRLSVGLEAAEDLYADLAQALNGAARG